MTPKTFPFDSDKIGAEPAFGQPSQVPTHAGIPGGQNLPNIPAASTELGPMGQHAFYNIPTDLNAGFRLLDDPKLPTIAPGTDNPHDIPVAKNSGQRALENSFDSSKMTEHPLGKV